MVGRILAIECSRCSVEFILGGVQVYLTRAVTLAYRYDFVRRFPDGTPEYSTPDSSNHSIEPTAPSLSDSLPEISH